MTMNDLAMSIYLINLT